jgi:hypothetical protein
MSKSATDIMQEIIFSAVIDAITALKAASKGVPNNLLRDLNAVHANTTPADLPPELQAAITTSVRGAFTRLLKEGYSVSPGQPAPQRMPPRTDSAGQPPRHRRPTPGGGDPRKPRGNGRPGGGGPGNGAPRGGDGKPKPPRGK